MHERRLYDVPSPRGGEEMSEETDAEYQIRIYNECKFDEEGNSLQAWHFINWVLKHYPEVMDEFNKHDMLMSGQIGAVIE